MSGYVYILINPSLNGLLKIGMTSRSPEERALELSSGTNMPTPFVVAYEEMVPDGYLAEKIIHQHLADAGYPINDNREFFAMPLKQAIQIVSSVAEHVRGSDISSDQAEQAPCQLGDADYYFHKGLKELGGDEDTLQDYAAAYDSLQRACDLGCIEAYFFLANMHILGQGVSQSAEKALSLLKTGGQKGDPGCYQAMWNIYAGNTILAVKNENNAELCFKWLIDSAAKNGDSALIDTLDSYLRHSHEQLGDYGEKFPIEKFPGKHVQHVIDLCCARVQNAFAQIKKARLAGIPYSQLECTWYRGGPPSIGDILTFHFFLSDCVERGDQIMRKTMVGIERADLEYCFAKAKDVTATIREYLPYLTTTVTTEIEQKLEEKKQRGFFSRLFSAQRGRS